MLVFGSRIYTIHLTLLYYCYYYIIFSSNKTGTLIVMNASSLQLTIRFLAPLQDDVTTKEK